MAELKTSALNKFKPKVEKADSKEEQNIQVLQNRIKELEKELADREQQATKDEFNIKERLVSFVKTRPEGKVSDITSRTTFVIEDRVLERLENFMNYMEASNVSNSNYNPHNKNQTQLLADRGLAKGILSKLVSLSISESLDEWNKIDSIPNTKKVRYTVKVPRERGKGTKTANHRAYIFELKGITYGIAIDERSNQLEYLTTDSKNDNDYDGVGSRYGLSREEIIEWFEEKEKLTVK